MEAVFKYYFIKILKIIKLFLFLVLFLKIHYFETISYNDLFLNYLDYFLLIF